jgi:hypothetical protein
MTRAPIFLLAVPAALFAQQVPTMALVPEAGFPAEWTDVRGVRELRDGKVIVLDSRDQAVKLADFKTGAATMIGRKGRGPGEYQLPLALVALPGDSSVIVDMANPGAPVVITPAGKAGDPLPGMRGEHAVRFLDVGGRIDGRGRIYRTGIGAMLDRDPIERLDRATGRIDTVGWNSRRIVSPLLPPPEQGARPKYAAAGKPIPLASLRAFEVTRDGALVILSPDPYRVTFVVGGKETEGPVIPYERLRVTEADKVEWRTERAKPVASLQFGAGGQVTAGYTQPRRLEEPDAWPEFLPPYTLGPSGVERLRIAPNGTIWIERAVNAGMPPLYDVLTPAGTLAYRVTMPKRTRIVGFGPSGIYAVRLDDDDLEYLQRFRFPTVSGR